jgi:hypothetical protein
MLVRRLKMAGDNFFLLCPKSGEENFLHRLLGVSWATSRVIHITCRLPTLTRVEKTANIEI